MDKVHWEYERLIFLRQMMINDPKSTLEALVESIEHSLKDFPLNKGEICSIGEKIDTVRKENFLAYRSYIFAEL